MRTVVSLCLVVLAAAAGAQCVSEPAEHVVAPRSTDPAIDTDTENHYVYFPAISLTGCDARRRHAGAVDEADTEGWQRRE